MALWKMTFPILWGSALWGLALLAPVAPAAALPYIELGPSDGLALDQPRVTVELFSDPDGNNSLGPILNNVFFLDTGANSIMAMKSAVDYLLGCETQGTFVEQGIAGDHPLETSEPYRFDFAGTSGLRRTINDTCILSDEFNDFPLGSPPGIVGMPAMVNRVTTLDFTGWVDGLANMVIYMDVALSDGPEDPPPGNGHRYSVPVDNRFQFDPADQDHTGELPVWADVPFLTATAVAGADRQTTDFLFDTGAQMSLISEDLAFSLGADANGDGDLLDDLLPNGTEQIFGVGGVIEVPKFWIDEIRVPTNEGVELVWTDAPVLVLTNANPADPPLGQLPFDGVFGSDLLTSGWLAAWLSESDGGYIDYLFFDFREMEDEGLGTIYFDLNPAYDNVRVPEPGSLVLLSAGGFLLLLWRLRRRSSK